MTRLRAYKEVDALIFQMPAAWWQGDVTMAEEREVIRRVRLAVYHNHQEHLFTMLAGHQLRALSADANTAYVHVRDIRALRDFQRPIVRGVLDEIFARPERETESYSTVDADYDAFCAGVAADWVEQDEIFEFNPHYWSPDRA